MDEDDLTKVRNVWETLARTDPLWAILSVPSKKGRRWDIEEFFGEGKAEIDNLLGKVRESGYALSPGAALDFGCGVGRLTQPLADYFAHVTGVDISPTMIELACQFNRQGTRVDYRQNSADNLSLFPDQTFDFLYSNIVLQHMQPQYAIGYIKEFFRITRPGGFIVFQIPSHFTDDYLPYDSPDTPLPKPACRSDLHLVSGPATVHAGEVVTLTIQVTNLSAEDWTQRRTLQLNIGNHWLLPNRGTAVVHDDGRSRLPGRLRAGESVCVPLDVKAPDLAGKYVLAIDVVQEGVRWFQNAGSKPLLIPIPVEAPVRVVADETGSPSTAGAAERPVTFMMEGVHKDEILKLIAGAGARLVFTEEHITEWYSYKYYVIR